MNEMTPKNNHIVQNGPLNPKSMGGLKNKVGLRTRKDKVKMELRGTLKVPPESDVFKTL